MNTRYLSKKEALVEERYLTESEETQLFKTVKMFGDVYARRDSAWMQLLRQTGIRVGTMAGLTVLDARLALKTKRLVLRDEICKRKKGYTVHANKKALSALRCLLKIRLEIGYHLQPDQPLVMSRKHKAMSVRAYQDRMKHWREKAQLQIKATPHYFRHTLGHRIMDRSTASNPLLVVKSALGHSTVDSSAVYAKPNRGQIIDDLEACI